MATHLITSHGQKTFNLSPTGAHTTQMIFEFILATAFTILVSALCSIRAMILSTTTAEIEALKRHPKRGDKLESTNSSLKKPARQSWPEHHRQHTRCDHGRWAQSTSGRTTAMYCSTSRSRWRRHSLLLGNHPENMGVSIAPVCNPYSSTRSAGFAR